MNYKIEALLKNIDRKCGLLVSDVTNMRYMSDFSGEASYLVIGHQGQALLTDQRYDAQAREETDFDVDVWMNNQRPDPETILKYCKKYGIEKLMFNDASLSFRHYDQLNKYFNFHSDITLHPMSGLIEPLRLVKSDYEVECIRKACQIADEALHKTTDMIKVGVSELEIVATLEYHMKCLGAENISFDTIVLSGEKTAYPHGKPSQKKLESGDFLQIDFGALYKGYHSDMSRTFIIGAVSKEKENLYQLMLTSTNQAIEAIKDGVAASYIDQVARMGLGEFETYYYPGLGHGVGMDIHELPFLSHNSEEILKTNEVITIEPGVYIPGFGGMRIEDTVLVTENGYEILTLFPKHMMILE